MLESAFSGIAGRVGSGIFEIGLQLMKQVAGFASLRRKRSVRHWQSRSWNDSLGVM